VKRGKAVSGNVVSALGTVSSHGLTSVGNKQPKKTSRDK
jgi:hypothetical protein